LKELPRSGQPPIATERLEAHITSIASAGSSRWTLSLINEKIVELNYIDSISNESIRQILKKAGRRAGPLSLG